MYYVYHVYSNRAPCDHDLADQQHASLPGGSLIYIRGVHAYSVRHLEVHQLLSSSEGNLVELNIVSTFHAFIVRVHSEESWIGPYD